MPVSLANPTPPDAVAPRADVRIAFVTTYDARDVRSWSGLGYFISRALAAEGLELDFVGPLALARKTRLLLKLKAARARIHRRGRYFAAHDALAARDYARQVDRALARRPDANLVFSPGTVPIAFLRDRRPIAYWSDATHAAIFDFYQEYSNLRDETRRDGHRIERGALDRAAAALFSSDWAATSAHADYGAPAERVHVAPFGANLETPPTDAQVAHFIASRPHDVCRLLFIGVDWARKGGPLAVEVADQLNRRGLRTELTVVGCQPFEGAETPPFVRVEGFLHKAANTDSDRLHELLAGCHFLIVPSQAECYGLVYCEANAFGAPCIARRVGGVPTIIHDGDNGWLFDRDAPAERYAAAIHATFSNRDRYRTMAQRARDHFNERLNWGAAGKRAADILRRCLAAQPANS